MSEMAETEVVDETDIAREIAAREDAVIQSALHKLRENP